MTTTSPYTVDSTTSYNNSLLSTTVGNQATGKQSLDQTDYLKLMTAQLQYQDPFSPMDNSQMVAQMAQFSQVAAQSAANDKLDTIASSLSGTRLSDAANWIGKSMLVKSSTVAPTGAGEYAGQITLGADAAGVKVNLIDSAGNTVKSIDMGAQKAGPVNFYWDGKDDAGTQTTGPLTIQVTGGTATQTAAWATIAAVQSPSSGSDQKLITTLGNFTAADALSLS
ncbi:MAG TPA: flagellar hook capping FlgD N-terminal domain-containing protein [Sphingobium sp.]|uniref:flagellar hook assembly protein FlgD n=1 Tax=Sphingobium sp. TaxID=1912891 RepID=UPI002ED35A61